LLTSLAVVIGVLIAFELLALLWLATSVGSYKKYWQQQNTTSDGELLYVALGDSTAQGIGASRARKSYVGLVADALARDSGASVKIINLSVSGAKVQDVTRDQLHQLQDLPLDDKTLITLAIGANDMRTFDEITFRKDTDELLSQLPPQTGVADVPYFGGGRFRRLESNVTKANTIIHQLVRKHDLRLVPLHEITKDRDSLLVYSADLFHPSNIGYKNWADAFVQALDI